MIFKNAFKPSVNFVTITTCFMGYERHIIAHPIRGIHPSPIYLFLEITRSPQYVRIRINTKFIFHTA